MIYTQEVENMCPVAQGVHHGAAPVPTEGKWVQNKEVKDISGFTHGVGWWPGAESKPPRSSLRLSPGGRWRPTYQGRRAAPATASG